MWRSLLGIDCQRVTAGMAKLSILGILCVTCRASLRAGPWLDKFLSTFLAEYGVVRIGGVFAAVHHALALLFLQRP